MTTSNDIANQAIVYMGDNQAPVTGNAPSFDSSTAGKALATFYYPCVQAVMREFGWDFARNTQALVVTGNTAPYPWTYEYQYPDDCIEIWQLLPPSGGDLNNPLPQNWAIANNVVGGAQTRVIHTNLGTASAVYNNAPNENTWDTGFREAVVRLLASILSLAVAGKPDTASALLSSGSAFETIAEGRSG